MIFSLLFSLPVYAEDITLQWDQVEGVDGYLLFQTIRATNPDTGVLEHIFDYNTPITTELYPDGKIPQTTTALTVSLPGVENADTKYMFVARAFRGEDQSENSNTVAYVVSLVPPDAPQDLTGSYNKESNSIELVWTQAEEVAWRSISHYTVFYQIDNGEWIELGKVENGETTLNTAFEAVPDGEVKNVAFAVVAYRRSGVFSADSSVLTLIIDRSLGEVPTVPNLRVKIEIPVI